jgi:hypothetical protein
MIVEMDNKVKERRRMRSEEGYQVEIRGMSEVGV